MKRSFDFILHTFHPRICIGCLKPLTVDGRCPDCDTALGRARLTVPVLEQSFKVRIHTDLEMVWSCYEYSTVSKTVFVCKNNNYPYIVKEVAAVAGDFYSEYCAGMSFDGVLPMPEYGKNNGVFPLAERFAARIGLNCRDDILVKTRMTAKQHLLEREQRIVNLKDAFIVAKPELVEDRRILLFDDVTTTGSSLNECAKVLKKAGARSVCGFTFAAAMLNRH